MVPDCSSSSFKNSKPTERETSAPQHNRLFLNRESVEGGCWLHRTTDVTVVTMTRTRFATVRPLHPCSSLEHPHAQPQTASVSRAPPPLEPLPCCRRQPPTPPRRPSSTSTSTSTSTSRCCRRPLLHTCAQTNRHSLAIHPAALPASLRRGACLASAALPPDSQSIPHAPPAQRHPWSCL